MPKQLSAPNALLAMPRGMLIKLLLTVFGGCAIIYASVMHPVLALKRKNPLPEDTILNNRFSLGLSRKEECPKPAEIDACLAC